MKGQRAKNSQESDLYWKLWPVLDDPRCDLKKKVMKREKLTMLHTVSLNKCPFDQIATLGSLTEQGNSIIRFRSILGWME